MLIMLALKDEGEKLGDEQKGHLKRKTILSPMSFSNKKNNQKDQRYFLKLENDEI